MERSMSLNRLSSNKAGELVKGKKEQNKMTNESFKGTKTIDQVLGKEKLEFYPDLEQWDQEALMGVTFKIEAVKVVEDWDGRFGTSSFVLAKIQLVDGNEITSLLGGKVVLKQVRKLLAARALPVVAMLNKVNGQMGEYFVLDKPV
jgi:hypothetical protein